MNKLLLTLHNKVLIFSACQVGLCLLFFFLPNNVNIDHFCKDQIKIGAPLKILIMTWLITKLIDPTQLTIDR